MGVSAKGERYLCEICGNEVVVEKVGGGTLVCCGQDMTLIDEKKSHPYNFIVNLMTYIV